MGKPRALYDYPPIMDSHGVAGLLGHPVKTIQIWCRAGMLPAHREPGARASWFVRDELIEWMKSETRVTPD